MTLPEETIRRLQPLFPTLDLSMVEVEVREPERTAGCFLCPLAWVKAGGSPRPGLIQISPRYWSPETAEGLALIAHELYHQAQQTVPAFEALYDAMAADLEARGLPSWAHPLERPAYEFEKVIQRLLR